MARDLIGKDVAWYRFTETPGKIYGPRDFAFVFRAYGTRETCEVCGATPDGKPDEQWFQAMALRARLKSQAVQPGQLRRLRELGVAVDLDSIDKISATELIEITELRGPATESEIADAKARGADVWPGMSRAELNRALIPIEDAEDEVEAEQERREELAPRRQGLARIGVTVDEGIDEEALQRAEDALESYEMALEEAKDWGLQASQLKGRKPRTPEAADAEASLLNAWIALVQEYDENHIALASQSLRVPSAAALKRARNELFAAMAAGTPPSNVGEWLVQRVQALPETKKPQTGRAPDNPPTPRPTRARRADRTPTTAEQGIGYVVLIGVLVVLLLIGAIVSS
jgi:cell division septation protein DedD